MKKLTQIGMLAAFALLVSNLSAQIILTPTTLSTAVTSTTSRTIVVASATPNASTADNFAVGTGVIIDGSYGLVTSVSGTTIGVNWGNSSGTINTLHTASSLVWTARANNLFTKPIDPAGACTRTTEVVLPQVNARTKNISDCLGGRWVTGAIMQFPQFRTQAPDPGNVAYTAINTNGTALAATTLFCTEVNLRANKLLTGIAILNGTTVGTDNHYVVLYDATGNALANSALAGAVSAGASVYQQYNFTKQFFATGPAQYFACVQSNGATDTLRMAITGTNDNILTKGQTAAVFGTVPALVAPTTFTTAVGPYVFLN